MLVKGTTTTGISVCSLTLMFTVVGRDRLLHCKCLLSVCNLSTCYRRIDVWFQQRFMSLCTILINSYVHINKWHNYVIITHGEIIFLAEHRNIPIVSSLVFTSKRQHFLLGSSTGKYRLNGFRFWLIWVKNQQSFSDFLLSVRCLFACNVYM